ncbi:hypothetical protein KR009_010824 [Drosophila setifemur]|nr:hypothetical protein KR009_010824 [Drosophila setifemur]
MSLQDESFPADELFDELNSLGTSRSSREFKRQFAEHHQPEAFERDAAPFLGLGLGLGQVSDCSAETSYSDAANKSAKTCVSDPIGRDQEEEEEDGFDSCETEGGTKSNDRLTKNSNTTSNKAVSYQDIHSAAVKRRYQHVPSKVGKYIAEIHAQERKRRNSGSSGSNIQRHSSMPEYLTPRAQQQREGGNGGGHFSVDELHKMNESLANSSEEGQTSNQEEANLSYEQLLSENEALQQEKHLLEQEKSQLQSYSNYLQERLDKKVMEGLQLKMNFEAARTQLSDCKDKMERYQRHSLRSLNHCLPVGIPKATQTEGSSSVSPALGRLMENATHHATPNPNTNANHTYNTSDGSIELALLSVAPQKNQPSNLGQAPRVIHPLSLDFSNESGEADGSGNGEARGRSSARPKTRRGPGPNNSESSHPSSNDSAIEVEGHESRSPFQQQGASEWGPRQGMYYFDRRNNRLVEVRAINLSQDNNQSRSSTGSQSGADSIAQLLNNSPQSGNQFRTKRGSLGGFMMRVLGPCVRCSEAGRVMNANNATYTIGIPLLEDERVADRRVQR